MAGRACVLNKHRCCPYDEPHRWLSTNAIHHDNMFFWRVCEYAAADLLVLGRWLAGEWAASRNLRQLRSQLQRWAALSARRQEVGGLAEAACQLLVHRQVRC